jgi:hypothetical protein
MKQHPAHLRTLATALVAVLSCLTESACGGTDAVESAAAPEAVALAVAMAAPLLDEHGRPRAPHPEAVPAYGTQFTRAGHYALRHQAEMLDAARRGDVVWVDVECCALDAAQNALDVAAGLFAAHDLPPDAPVFVTGRDLSLAAWVADRLDERGHSRVFLVTR